jgi:dephospho-CoA kinase
MIIGITGTDGAGKGAVVDYLVQQKGFAHYSSSGQIITEITARGLPVSRDTLRTVGNDLRREFGNDILIKRSLTQVAADGAANAVIESVRAKAEAETLQAAGGVLLVVDADQQLRYERIVGRGSAKDHVTFETFCAQEALEMNDPDPNGMQKATVMQMANATILNNGDMSALHVRIDQWLATID